MILFWDCLLEITPQIFFMEGRKKLKKQKQKDNPIYQPLRPGRIWHKVNF